MPIIERYEKRGMVQKVSGVPPPEQVICTIVGCGNLHHTYSSPQVFEEVRKLFVGL